MLRTARLLTLLIALVPCLSLPVSAQTSGSIQGEVRDEKQAVIPKAKVTLRNVQTNDTRTTDSDDEGGYRFNNVPVGNYELIIEAQGFGKYEQSGITLALNQNAVVDASLKPGDVQASVSVVENASLLNTTTAELGVRFDSRRISELPLATNRNVYNVAFRRFSILPAAKWLSRRTPLIAEPIVGDPVTTGRTASAGMLFSNCHSTRSRGAFWDTFWEDGRSTILYLPERRSVYGLEWL